MCYVQVGWYVVYCMVYHHPSYAMEKVVSSLVTHPIALPSSTTSFKQVFGIIFLRLSSPFSLWSPWRSKNTMADQNFTSWSLPSGNQTWQWNIFKLRFLAGKHIELNGFPASHVTGGYFPLSSFSSVKMNHLKIPLDPLNLHWSPEIPWWITMNGYYPLAI